MDMEMITWVWVLLDKNVQTTSVYTKQPQEKRFLMGVSCMLAALKFQINADG